MTILFTDSFDHYDTAHIDEKYTSVSSPSISAGNGRNSTACLRFTGAGNVSKTLPGSYSTLIMGAAFRSNTSLLTGMFMAFYDGGTVQMALHEKTDGTIEIRRGSTVVATSANAMSADQYYYVEFKCTFHNSSGTAEVKVNGSSWTSFSGDTTNTANATANQFLLVGQNSASRDFDDLVVLNSLGTTNNDYLGDIRVEAILPDGAGSSAEWTPLSGNNYANVDDNPPDDDTSYNYTATSGVIDTFAFGSLASTAGTVYGIQLNIYAKKDDASPRAVRGVYTRASEHELSLANSVNTTYAYFTEVVETDPETAAAWTIANINAAEFGYKAEM